MSVIQVIDYGKRNRTYLHKQHLDQFKYSTGQEKQSMRITDSELEFIHTNYNEAADRPHCHGFLKAKIPSKFEIHSNET